MSVYRETDLPTAPPRGRILVAASVAQQTRLALQAFRGAEGRHEGLVFWVGRRAEGDALVMAAIVPACNHGPQHVLVPEGEVGRVSKISRSVGLAIVAQVHSHPSDDTRHSEGDDKLIVMPFEGMFSLVVGCYGAGGIMPQQGAGLHQFQDGRWFQIPAAEATGAMIVVPQLVTTHPQRR